MKQLNNFMRQRENDPHGLDKGDINKFWCYETIESVDFGEVDLFEKQPKQSYLNKDSSFNQLDFFSNLRCLLFLSSSLLVTIKIQKNVKS